VDAIARLSVDAFLTSEERPPLRVVVPVTHTDTTQSPATPRIAMASDAQGIGRWIDHGTGRPERPPDADDLAMPEVISFDGVRQNPPRWWRRKAKPTRRRFWPARHHQPSDWMALQQTQGLIAEIEKAGIPAYQPRQERRSQCT